MWWPMGYPWWGFLANLTYLGETGFHEEVHRRGFRRLTDDWLRKDSSSTKSLEWETEQLPSVNGWYLFAGSPLGCCLPLPSPGLELSFPCPHFPGGLGVWLGPSCGCFSGPFQAILPPCFLQSAALNLMTPGSAAHPALPPLRCLDGPAHFWPLGHSRSTNTCLALLISGATQMTSGSVALLWFS